MSAADQPPTAPGRGKPRPTRADQRGFERIQATALSRALDDAKAWRTGYAMLAGGISALLGFIGTQLDHDTASGWRLALSILLGGGLLLVAAALAMILTIEGGRQAVRLNLREIVELHNSLEAYQAHQASVALQRLDSSKKFAATGAALAFLGLLVTLWMPGPAKDPAPPPTPASTTAPPAPPRPAPASTTAPPAPPTPSHT